MDRVCYVLKKDLIEGMARIYFEYRNTPSCDTDARIAVPQTDSQDDDAQVLAHRIRGTFNRADVIKKTEDIAHHNVKIDRYYISTYLNWKKWIENF